MIRGVHRYRIFLDDTDRNELLRLLLLVRARYGWHVLAYCLMDNHYHLLVETPDANLSAGMQWLNARYAEYFNDRYGHAGHVFDRRFRSVVVQDERQLAEQFRYIVLNPVRAGMCERVDMWPWSSYVESVGLAPPHVARPDRLLRYFGGRPEGAHAELAAFVRADTGGV
jgi:putative transposase